MNIGKALNPRMNGAVIVCLVTGEDRESLVRGLGPRVESGVLIPPTVVGAVSQTLVAPPGNSSNALVDRVALAKRLI